MICRHLILYHVWWPELLHPVDDWGISWYFVSYYSPELIQVALSSCHWPISWYGGFLKCGPPQIIHLIGFLYKPSILGIPLWVIITFMTVYGHSCEGLSLKSCKHHMLRRIMRIRSLPGRTKSTLPLACQARTGVRYQINRGPFTPRLAAEWDGPGCQNGPVKLRPKPRLKNPCASNPWKIIPYIVRFRNLFAKFWIPGDRLDHG